MLCFFPKSYNIFQVWKKYGYLKIRRLIGKISFVFGVSPLLFSTDGELQYYKLREVRDWTPIV